MPINNVTFSGTLGRTPERVGDKGAKSRLAVYQGKDKPTLWLDLTTWGEWSSKDLLACDKGERLTVAGRLELREWTSREGEKRQGFGVIASSIERHERKQRGGYASPPPSAPAPAALPADDEIPF